MRRSAQWSYRPTAPISAQRFRAPGYQATFGIRCVRANLGRNPERYKSSCAKAVSGERASFLRQNVRPKAENLLHCFGSHVEAFVAHTTSDERQGYPTPGT